jgi:hypothetical protein
MGIGMAKQRRRAKAISRARRVRQSIGGQRETAEESRVNIIRHGLKAQVRRICCGREQKIRVWGI